MLAVVQNGMKTGATISKWVVIYPKYAFQNVHAFVDDNMLKDARRLGVRLLRELFRTRWCLIL